jgi:hypothetical protein
MSWKNYIIPTILIISNVSFSTLLTVSGVVYKKLIYDKDEHDKRELIQRLNEIESLLIKEQDQYDFTDASVPE